jgi:ParB family transcriptional regulator, chromosome partitioning protein
MPPRRGGLGRGLDALIGRPAPPPVDVGEAGASTEGMNRGAEHGAGGVGGAGSAGDGALLQVELGRIERNPRQPRRQMDETQLGELADSIREHGLLQPVVVTRLDDGAGEGPPRYQLVAGERRWQAAKIAGLVRIPVLVRDVTPRELLELALVENVQRADLNAIEAAAAYQQLAQDFGMTQEQIGSRVGKSRFAIANTLRLLQLPAAVQQAIVAGQISEGHARAILGLADPEAQRQLTLQVVEHGLSVRQTEELVRRLQVAAPPERRSGRPAAPDVVALEDRFRAALGTKVSLTRTKRGGRLTIFYYDEEQLQALYDRLATE